MLDHNKTMSVSKNPKTLKWDCSIWYRDWRGERKHTTKRGFDKKREAEEYERKFLDKQQSNDITMKKAAEEYIAHMKNLCELGEIKESTLQNNTRIINSYIVSYFNDIKISSVKTSDVTKWLAYLTTHSKLKKRLGSRTLVKYRSMLNQIFLFCQKNHNLEHNPVTLVERPKFYSNDKRAKLWTVEEFKKCYDIITEPVFKVLFSLIYWSGLRLGEALALTPNDIKPDRISVTKGVMCLEHSKAKIDTPKNVYSVREVMIPNYLYMQLRKFIESQYELKDNELIFAGINHDRARNDLRKWIRRAKLPYISPHILRHSYASILYSSSHDITVVASQIGHADVNTTFRYYAHMIPQKDRQAISDLEQNVILGKNDEKNQSETHLELIDGISTSKNE